MNTEKVVFQLTKLAEDIRYNISESKSGKNKKLREDATEELIQLSRSVEQIYRKNNILEITHPHLKPEQYSEWYSGMGIGKGLLHDINMAVLKLKETDNKNIEQ
ncbi:MULTISPECIES: hypothetical protein [Chryseobacterium]|uniref:hypothetical protein n=1 Tax=Chryseobacterium TaxID=59732 RepID=UPI001109E5D0|nr:MULTISPECIES: hypothetical protein [Chryseobacterium]MBF6643895.1 hypothetical protein [Chryseobacterium indologenes]MBU3047146.1 hypothetical protein [Chryseobacterium indologenes]QQQ72378.1 hypothetical protein JHW31_06540 [Chryseobacterium indologenes]TLX26601.1 hypothetical protein FE904_07040 [Chryseobacterium indologenes]WET50773.1 hypothetical protein PYS58_06480 [Chryseobacterium indologenes]